MNSNSKQPLEIFKDVYFYERSWMEKQHCCCRRKRREESDEERM
jgi:hypothetical protein